MMMNDDPARPVGSVFVATRPNALSVKLLPRRSARAPKYVPVAGSWKIVPPPLTSVGVDVHGDAERRADRRSWASTKREVALCRGLAVSSDDAEAEPVHPEVHGPSWALNETSASTEYTSSPPGASGVPLATDRDLVHRHRVRGACPAEWWR